MPSIIIDKPLLFVFFELLSLNDYSFVFRSDNGSEVQCPFHRETLEGGIPKRF